MKFNSLHFSEDVFVHDVEHIDSKLFIWALFNGVEQGDLGSVLQVKGSIFSNEFQEGEETFVSLELPKNFSSEDHNVVIESGSSL